MIRSLFDRAASRALQDAAAPMAAPIGEARVMHPGREIDADVIHFSLAALRACRPVPREPADPDAMVETVVAAVLAATGQTVTDRMRRKVADGVREGLSEIGAV